MQLIPGLTLPQKRPFSYYLQRLEELLADRKPPFWDYLDVGFDIEE
jgi:hypothetical protein